MNVVERSCLETYKRTM